MVSYVCLLDAAVHYVVYPSRFITKCNPRRITANSSSSHKQCGYVTQFMFSSPSASGCLSPVEDLGGGGGEGCDLGRNSIVRSITTTKAESATNRN